MNCFNCKNYDPIDQLINRIIYDNGKISKYVDFMGKDNLSEAAEVLKNVVMPDCDKDDKLDWNFIRVLWDIDKKREKEKKK